MSFKVLIGFFKEKALCIVKVFIGFFKEKAFWRNVVATVVAGVIIVFSTTYFLKEDSIQPVVTQSIGNVIGDNNEIIIQNNVTQDDLVDLSDVRASNMFKKGREKLNKGDFQDIVYLFKKGLDLYSHEKYREAINAYNKAIEISPDFSEP